jgi:hypothetical protein
MNGAIPLLPQYAFIAWCSVKAQEQRYLYLSYVKVIVNIHFRQVIGKITVNIKVGV